MHPAVIVAIGVVFLASLWYWLLYEPEARNHQKNGDVMTISRTTLQIDNGHAERIKVQIEEDDWRYYLPFDRKVVRVFYHDWHHYLKIKTPDKIEEVDNFERCFFLGEGEREIWVYDRRSGKEVCHFALTIIPPSSSQRYKQ